MVTRNEARAQGMVSPSLKKMLYDAGVTITDISEEVGISRRGASKALSRWYGKTGNPRGKTREVLQTVESYIGRPVYQELEDHNHE